MASKLKSVMASRNHRRSPSELKEPSEGRRERIDPCRPMVPSKDPFLPFDHPHAQQQLRERTRPSENVHSAPKKSIEVYEDDNKALGLHKRTKSSVSLKSLMGNDRTRDTKAASPEKQEKKKPKKSKSSTSLSALLPRPRSSKGLKPEVIGQPKDKENQTPPNTGEIAPPPIWAQFASQQDSVSPAKVPLNDVDDLADEMALYTPQDYSPSKQRNFGEYERPTLSRGIDKRSRPKSAVLPSAHSGTSFTETLSRLRKRSEDNGRNRLPSNDKQSRITKQESRRCSVERNIAGRRTSEEQPKKVESSEEFQSGAKRGPRVMAAVAAFNDRLQELPRPPASVNGNIETPMDPVAINDAFEELLDSRNIPQNVREKMRSLTTRIKADFIKKETLGTGPTTTADSSAQRCPERDEPKRRKGGPRSVTDDGSNVSSDGPKSKTTDAETPKKSRPRSLTFTRSKNDVNAKTDRPVSHARTKSSDSSSSKSLTSSGAAQALSFMSRTPRAALPEDYISYLQKVREPQVVEVGRIQKLRRLLRNETVLWVDTFIEKGGMAEVVDLLYRIMDIEWREEHEDTLLHETLLCLKALCTTSSALQQLANIQSTLFPSLLTMLFDKERKGPSEFITRGIIISLLFTYLSTSSPYAMDSRAHTLLSYLRDPSKPDEAQPPGFIASIYHPRPFRTWCNEIVSVTKEVFWIFLHHTNIVPYPEGLDGATSYTTRHFPGERPPVPAAPYIGGVEWDATNYLAGHMDLLNGLIASLPTLEERNALRQELKDSGFEKCMGASLRTCKEKFYGAVHAGLTTWIGAAREDGWDVRYVKEGPRMEETIRTPSPKKRKHEAPPKLDMPKLDLGVAVREDRKSPHDDGWL